jgi:hypothetical protein
MAPGHLVTSSVGSTRFSYGTYSGTSMATPAVAGAMALVRQYLTEGWYPTGAPVADNAMAPSAALLKAMAIACSRNDVTTFRVPDNSIGYGRLTLEDVLHFPGDTSRTLLIDPRDGLQDGQYVEYQVQVTNPVNRSRSCACWTDAPGNRLAGPDRERPRPRGEPRRPDHYRGNYLLNYASCRRVARFAESRELVRIPAPAAGLWTVRIRRSARAGAAAVRLCHGRRGGLPAGGAGPLVRPGRHGQRSK